MERALAISLLIHTGQRIQNLRSIRLDANIRHAGKRVFVDFRGAETKNADELTLELPAETVALLHEHLRDHRPLIPGADSQWLFTSPHGCAPRSTSAMRDAVSKPLKRHAGIDLNAHCFRHAIAKIVVERCPEMVPVISRRLGHKSINTTYRAYLGSETRAASRQVNRLLERARLNPELED